MPGKAFLAIGNQRVRGIAMINAALRAGRVENAHAVLGRNALAIHLEVARIKQPHVGAIDHGTAGVTAVLVIGQVR